ncbi:uncharacterized protein MELLADRAFT_115021 [Melampsora larici-populina 98AG31]|uniref:Uncharacterized protein n=1 Tax=Melampsora larici-populina (strain 98AG31 / pathotype 3-4-7) TaxID=747676 RepID=F4R6F6_MELLP|nr:uncharacterized protein MELLADRAFT_115021 [Melampsora larici-populina 98AG31]EGG11868.1 hypothetical protein MELLADRAFT_115021 [Melampsora larici-populina 98AG31]
MGEGIKRPMKFKTRIFLNLSIILVSISVFILNIFTILTLQNLNKTKHSNSLPVGSQGAGAQDVTEDYSFDDLISISLALVVITTLTSIITIINSIYLIFFPFKRVHSLNLVFSVVFIIFSLGSNIGYSILSFTKGPTTIHTNLFFDLPSNSNSTTIDNYYDLQSHQPVISNPFLYITLWCVKSFLICIWTFSIFSSSSIIFEFMASKSINEEFGQKVIIIYDHFSNSNLTSKERRSIPSTVPEKFIHQSFIEF